MSCKCSICGDAYLPTRLSSSEWCEGCFANFAGAQPPIGWADPPAPPPEAPSARDALAAYVDSSAQLTPRQVQWLRRMTERALPAEEEWT